MHVRKLAIGLLLGCVALVGCAGSKELTATAAPPKLPAIFSDNMVLQRGKPIPVWGWADPGRTVIVKFNRQQKTTKASPDGKWMVRLDAEAAGGPHALEVRAKQEARDGATRVLAESGPIGFKNVLIGEVWVCSGQSNMEWQLKNTTGEQEATESAANPKIRLFTVKKAQADQPLADCTGRWEECTPETAPGFSAVGYHFGRELQTALNVPVGLIHTSWGGTPVEAWMSEPLQQRDAELSPVFAEYEQRKQQHEKAMADYEKGVEKHKADAEKAAKEGKPAPAAPRKPWGPGWKPATLYNAMIRPIVPYGIGGAIWYQGESNAGNAIRYRKQFPAMIKNWRDDFGQGDVPFLFVQLANFMKREDVPTDPDWAWLREAQTMTLSTPKTGMAVIIDIGEDNDIHPRNKQDVGKRLALAAQAVAYGKQLVYSGPMYDSMKVEGGAIRLKLKHVGGGLVAKDESALKGFAIAGADKKFVWAEAKIDGDTVVVRSSEVQQPVAVRYAWANNPECNLYNKEGLPASPFRTDDWARAGK
jgi:sialate O-acetylesterase